MKKINIAIDGYSGTGKSSTARLVAKELGYTYVDSGAMYRAVTYHLLEKKIKLNSEEEVVSNLNNLNLEFVHQRIHLNGVDLEDRIREQRVSSRVSVVSAFPELRKKLVAIQQEMGKDKGVVMDGRDIGTVVFPDAELKIFMIADLEVRATRRYQELVAKRIKANLEEITSNLRERDALDSSRKSDPLKRVQDSKTIDTSGITLNDQVEKIVSLAKKLIDAN